MFVFTQPLHHKWGVTQGQFSSWVIFALQLLKSKILVEKNRESSMMSANGIFPHYWNLGINTNVIISLVGRIFHYQHWGYFQDKLNLQIIFMIASNCRTKQVAFVSFSHQYNDLFPHYLYLKEKILFQQHRIFVTHACVRPSDMLPFSAI